jgi:hypothetical protein
MPRSCSWAPGRCEWYAWRVSIHGTEADRFGSSGKAVRSVGSIVKEARDHQLGELMSVARAQLLGREAYQAWVVDTGSLEFLKDPWRLDKAGSPSVSRPLSDVRSPPFTGHKLA